MMSDCRVRRRRGPPLSVGQRSINGRRATEAGTRAGDVDSNTRKRSLKVQSRNYNTSWLDGALLDEVVRYEWMNSLQDRSTFTKLLKKRENSRKSSSPQANPKPYHSFRAQRALNCRVIHLTALAVDGGTAEFSAAVPECG
ncbi:hypothetical protein EVAR_92978_1 [Eumeta japonica]|uniref:Uncharacterized protein n=1 Tax=Eumeta variegata TaxID=151549 RepID=A0A4C1TDW7_EUMVA|nr:hypothetical protein EVAR_92978_1 [Eumeta japonica]